MSVIEVFMIAFRYRPLFLVCLFVQALLLPYANLFAQTSNAGRDLSVDDSHKQESVELMIIREFSTASTREQKHL